MAIANRVADFLIDLGIDYHVLPHPYTETSAESAESAYVEPDSLAKAVVVASGDGPKRHFRLAVLPASHDIDLKALADIYDEHLELAHEYELPVLFPDCAVGAVPVLGSAYQLETIVDQALDTETEVYFEAGDHEELIRISGEQFHDVMSRATFASFSFRIPRDEYRR